MIAVIDDKAENLTSLVKTCATSTSLGQRRDQPRAKGPTTQQPRPKA